MLEDMSPLSSVDSDLEGLRSRDNIWHAVPSSYQSARSASLSGRLSTEPITSSADSRSRRVQSRSRPASTAERSPLDGRVMEPIFTKATQITLQSLDLRNRQLEDKLSDVLAENLKLKLQKGEVDDLVKTNRHLKEFLVTRDFEYDRTKKALAKEKEKAESLTKKLDEQTESYKMQFEEMRSNQAILEARIKDMEESDDAVEKTEALTRELKACELERDNLQSTKVVLEMRVKDLEATVASLRAQLDRQMPYPAPSPHEERTAYVPNVPVPGVPAPRATVAAVPVEDTLGRGVPAKTATRTPEIPHEKMPRYSSPVQTTVQTAVPPQRPTSSRDSYLLASPPLTSREQDHRSHSKPSTPEPAAGDLSPDQLALLWGQPRSPRDALWLDELAKSFPTLIKLQPERIVELRNMLAQMRLQSPEPDKQLVLDRLEASLNEQVQKAMR